MIVVLTLLFLQTTTPFCLRQFRGTISCSCLPYKLSVASWRLWGTDTRQLSIRCVFISARRNLF